MSSLNFFNNIVLPELSFFVGEYGLRKQYSAYLKYVRGQDKNASLDVTSFVRVFNKRNKSRIWMYGGKIYTFDLSLDNPDNVVLRPHSNPEIAVLDIVHQNDELRFTRGALLVGIFGAAILLASTTYFYAIIVFMVGYFTASSVGRKIAVRFGVYW